MLTSLEINRRDWLKTTVDGIAGLAVTRSLLVTPARAQHEVERTAKTTESARLSGNKNSYGPSPMAVMAIVQNADKAFRYATRDEAKKPGDLLAGDNKVKSENVVVRSGSAEAENAIVGRAFPPAFNWCRISIGSPEEMTLAHAALKKVFAA